MADFNPIQFKRFLTSRKRPAANAVKEGELVLNVKDGRIYTANDTGKIVSLSDFQNGNGLNTGTNLNSVTRSGFYTVTVPVTTVNAPLGPDGTVYASPATLLVFGGADFEGSATSSDDFLQMYISASGYVYTRAYNKTLKTWGSWARPMFTGDKISVGGSITVYADDSGNSTITFKSKDGSTDNGVINVTSDGITITSGGKVAKYDSTKGNFVIPGAFYEGNNRVFSPDNKPTTNDVIGTVDLLPTVVKDLNDAPNGTYSLDNTLTPPSNLPPLDISSNFTGIVTTTPSGKANPGNKKQEFYSFSENTTYVRNGKDSTWTTWSRIYDNGTNKPTPAKVYSAYSAIPDKNANNIGIGLWTVNDNITGLSNFPTLFSGGTDFGGTFEVKRSGIMGYVQTYTNYLENTSYTRVYSNSWSPWTRIVTTDNMSYIPIGSVVAFATKTATSGWLECNGAAISRTTYAVLFTLIGTTYGAGDGTSTFNIPDLRGEFIRGWDNGRGVDFDYKTVNGTATNPPRVFGSWQKGSLQVGDDGSSTEVPFAINNMAGDGRSYWGYDSAGNDRTGLMMMNLSNGKVLINNTTYNVNWFSPTQGSAFYDSRANTDQGGVLGVSRPRNIAMMYRIKAFDGAAMPSSADFTTIIQELKPKLDEVYATIQGKNVALAGSNNDITSLNALTNIASIVNFDVAPTFTDSEKTRKNLNITAETIYKAYDIVPTMNATNIGIGLWTVKADGLGAVNFPVLYSGTTDYTGTFETKRAGQSGLSQSYINFKENTTYTRVTDGTTWTPWTRIVTTDNMSYVPLGTVLAFATKTASSGWLECNGSAISRTTYAGLFAIIGTTYGAGDGTTTFNIPDLRGEFIRGWDNGRGVDKNIDYTVRTFGGFQQSTLLRTAMLDYLGSDISGDWTSAIGLSYAYGDTETTQVAGSTFAANAGVKYPNGRVWNGGEGNDDTSIIGRIATSGLLAQWQGKQPTTEGNTNTNINPSDANLKASTGQRGTFNGTSNWITTRPRNVAMMYRIKAYDAAAMPSSADFTTVVQELKPKLDEVYATIHGKNVALAGDNTDITSLGALTKIKSVVNFDVAPTFSDPVTTRANLAITAETIYKAYDLIPDKNANSIGIGLWIVATGTTGLSNFPVLYTGITDYSGTFETKRAGTAGYSQSYVNYTENTTYTRVYNGSTWTAWTRIVTTDNMSYVPLGTVLAFATKTATAGWLECNGAAISRTSYPGLFTAIGTTYGAGDGSTTFNLPELRGEFIRGWDNGRGTDLNETNTSRSFGSWQKGSIAIMDPTLDSLNTSSIISSDSADSGKANTYSRGNAGYDRMVAADYPNIKITSVNEAKVSVDISDLNSYSWPAGLGASRPRNIAMMYRIKAYDAAAMPSSADFTTVVQELKPKLDEVYATIHGKNVALAGANADITSMSALKTVSSDVTFSGKVSISAPQVDTINFFGRLKRIIRLTAGSGNYTPGEDVQMLLVEMVGGGGSGGSPTAVDANTCSNAGTGACGGNYYKFAVTKASATWNTFAYTVGAGGASVIGSDGKAGGNTIFDVETVKGGQGGNANSNVYRKSEDYFTTPYGNSMMTIPPSGSDSVWVNKANFQLIEYARGDIGGWGFLGMQGQLGGNGGKSRMSGTSFLLGNTGDQNGTANNAGYGAGGTGTCNFYDKNNPVPVAYNAKYSQKGADGIILIYEYC